MFLESALFKNIYLDKVCTQRDSKIAKEMVVQKEEKESLEKRLMLAD